jgi:hypothetical protein
MSLTLDGSAVDNLARQHLQTTSRRSRQRAIAREDETQVAYMVQQSPKPMTTRIRQQTLDRDRQLAERLQAELNHEFNDEVEMAMMVTRTGRAVKFVQELLALHDTLISRHMAGSDDQPASISTVAVDDLVWLVKRVIAKQEENQTKNISTHVDLGYHYTQPENLDRIRSDGLLSLQERTERCIHSRFIGSQYGDGIYTCNDATSYRCSPYGPVGLLVARLKGTTASVVSGETYAVGNLVVLRSCEQCVPLIQFTSYSCDLLRQYHERVQSLIDTFFNGEVATPIIDSLASAGAAVADRD